MNGLNTPQPRPQSPSSIAVKHTVLPTAMMMIIWTRNHQLKVIIITLNTHQEVFTCVYTRSSEGGRLLAQVFLVVSQWPHPSP